MKQKKIRNLKVTSDRAYSMAMERFLIDINKALIPTSILETINKYIMDEEDSTIDKINKFTSSFRDKECVYSDIHSDSVLWWAELGFCAELGFFITVNTCVDNNNTYIAVLWNEREVPLNYATMNLNKFNVTHVLPDKVADLKYFKTNVAQTKAKDKVYSRLNISDEILTSAGFKINDNVEIIADINSGTITLKKGF